MDKDQKRNILECVPVIQGEGRSTGIPMILIRLGGCNLNCMFKGSICDAEESSWMYDKTAKTNFSLNDVAEIIKANDHIYHIMITGGQPTFSPNLFKELVIMCSDLGKLVEVEDNGTLYNPTFRGLPISLMSISPKLKNSIPEAGGYIEVLGRVVTEADVKKHKDNFRNLSSLERWINQFDYQLKFVISDEEEINEALSIAHLVNADMSKVMFMPEGATKEQLDSRRKWLYERCLELGIRYTDRLHIVIYDNKKGV